MISAIRSQFNAAFTKEKYQGLIDDLSRLHPGDLQFRVAETPVFLPRELKAKLENAAESIIDFILSPGFNEKMQAAIPKHLIVPGEPDFCEMISLDFGITISENGALEPQLIEMQGFPTMFYFQSVLADAYKKHYDLPAQLTNYFNNYDREQYFALLQRIILGGHAAENVILLEVKPKEQKTRIDFGLTEDFSGIETVCITDLIQEGKQLYYIAKNGQKTLVKRIYNRMIFDDFEKQKESLDRYVDITQDLEVEWLPHPNWFYKISKYALPFMANPFIPETRFLSDVVEIPADLENYVLKPLFSFSGQGVIIDVTKEDIANASNPSEWILQRKVTYAPAIEVPGGMAKCEIRLMYFQETGMQRPVLVNNLVRLSKGKMVGVRYNENFDWVGGSVALFEKS